MRKEWTIETHAKGAPTSLQAHTLAGSLQYRQDENALLATSNQRRLAQDELNRRLSKQLITLLTLEFDN